MDDNSEVKEEVEPPLERSHNYKTRDKSNLEESLCYFYDEKRKINGSTPFPVSYSDLSYNSRLRTIIHRTKGVAQIEAISNDKSKVSCYYIARWELTISVKDFEKLKKSSKKYQSNHK